MFGIVLLHLAYFEAMEVATGLPDQNSSSSYHPAVCNYPCTYHWHGQILFLFLPEIVAAVGLAVILASLLSSQSRRRAWTALMFATLLAAIAAVAGLIANPDLINAIART